MKKIRYIECSENSIPDSVRWDVPGRNQGQIIEVAYGDFGLAGYEDGSPYKRVTDRSEVTGAVTYYRRAGLGLKKCYVHFSNVGQPPRAQSRPSCADEKGFLSYRLGYETEVPMDEWTNAELWIHDREIPNPGASVSTVCRLRGTDE